MDSVITATVRASRPKIHRLPNSGPSLRAKKNQQIKILIVCGSVLLAGGLGMLSLMPEKTMLSRGILPAISVSSQDASEGASMIGEAQASVDGTIHADKRGKIISIHNDSEYIVGQMAKIIF